MRIKGLTLPVEGPATKATAQHNSPRGIPRLPVREKIRPAQPLQRLFREKLRPARQKTPILGHYEHAGRTFSRTGRTEVVTVKPTTPLQPLIQASVKPPSPMLAHEQHPLKPTTPMQAKNAPKTPNSHLQRRCRFHLRLGRCPQRRWQFQAHTDTHEQRRQRFQPAHLTGPQRRCRFQPAHLTGPQRRWRFHTTTHMVCRLPSCHQQAPMRPLIRKPACNSIG